VNDAISGLIRLQEMDKELDAFRQGVSRTGPRRAAIATARAGSMSAQEQSKKSLVDAQLLRKNLELEIEAKDQAVRKHSGELNSVKSNDAYKALIQEIEVAKKEKFILEDQVLVLMEKIEALQKEAKSAELETQRLLADLDGQDRSLDAEEAELKAKAEAKKAEREAFAVTLSAEARARYEAIQRGRPGFVAVVPINAMVCGGCRTGLPPNIVNQVMKGKEIITCDSCSRILYIIPKSVEPAASGEANIASSPMASVDPSPPSPIV
jgi:predicted  nucleic acid-binding Zn-ribbon protein